jgi:4-amino-4-deoxy-L-arabinose transferase-like glycosyltransferase
MALSPAMAKASRRGRADVPRRPAESAKRSATSADARRPLAALPRDRADVAGWWLPAIVLIAVALRIAHVTALRRTPWFSHLVVDPQFYDAWAQRVAGGDWLPDRPFYMDPLYAYVLAALYRIGGHDLLAARLLNVAFSAGACLLVARLGRQVGGARCGVLAALGFAVYGPDVFYVGELDKTSLSIFLAAATLTLALGSSLPSRLGAGVALGLTALTRANFLAFAPLGALAFVAAPNARSNRSELRRAILGAGLFLVGFAAALAPVVWANRTSGEWVLTTSQLGQNLYTGNNPTNPYGAYGVVPFVRANPHFEEGDFRREAETRAGRALDANGVSWFWVRETLAHVVTDPGFALLAFARKLVLFWNDFEISDNQDQYLLERDSAVLRLPLLGFGAVAPFAVLGGVVGFRRSRAVRLLVGFVCVYWLSLAVFFLFSRYRIQVVPALLPLAAVGATWLVQSIRAREGRRIALAAGVVITVAIFCFQTIGLFSRDHPRVVEMRMRHLADAYAAAGDVPTAIAALQEGVAPCPHGCPWALSDLFELYLRTGRAAEGEAYFRDFIAGHPQQRDAPGYLEKLRAAQGG